MSDLEDGSEAVKRLGLLEGKYSKVESILGQILGHLKSTQNPAPPTTAPPTPSAPVQPAPVASAASTSPPIASAPSTSSPCMSAPGPSSGSFLQSFPPNVSYPGIPVGLGGPPLQYNPYAFFPGAGYFPYPEVGHSDSVMSEEEEQSADEEEAPFSFSPSTKEREPAVPPRLLMSSSRVWNVRSWVHLPGTRFGTLRQ